MKPYYFGIIAERISILLLRIKFYRILKWRYKTHFGEIDIIAQKSKTIIFIEVKARFSNSNIEEVVTERQIKRMKRASELFIARNSQFQKYAIRHDFIRVNRFLYPRHFQNFFN